MWPAAAEPVNARYRRQAAAIAPEPSPRPPRLKKSAPRLLAARRIPSDSPGR